MRNAIIFNCSWFVTVGYKTRLILSHHCSWHLDQREREREILCNFWKKNSFYHERLLLCNALVLVTYLVRDNINHKNELKHRQKNKGINGELYFSEWAVTHMSCSTELNVTTCASKYFPIGSSKTKCGGSGGRARWAVASGTDLVRVQK